MKTPAMEQVSRWLAAKPKFLSMYVWVNVTTRARETTNDDVGWLGGGGGWRMEERARGDEGKGRHEKEEMQMPC